MKKINDRFNFDKLFRALLNKGFTNEEASDYILNNFSLSALVFQERIENKYYLRISQDDIISKDLEAFQNEIFRKVFLKKLDKIIN